VKGFYNNFEWELKKDQELQEKIQLNIKLQEEALAAKNYEAPEEFELRKSPREDSTKLGFSTDPTSHLPRSLLLSQQANASNAKPTSLYDEDDQTSKDSQSNQAPNESRDEFDNESIESESRNMGESC